MISSKEIMAQRLSKMVQFPTVSYENEEQMDFTAFARLRDFLAETYPAVHRTMKLEIVGRAGLLYTWKGKGASGKRPVMFTTHQDVVPANESNWTYPPFSGQIADGFVWGRGSSDSKSLLLAHMETMEALIEEGFEPDFDIFLGYGYNEEVGGGVQGASAKRICQALADQGVRLGILIDEGGFITPADRYGADGLIAHIYVAEKGIGNYLVYKNGIAGHTAVPGKINPIVDVARAVVRIADRTIEYRMTQSAAQQFSYMAKLMPQYQEILSHPGSHLDEIVCLFADNPLMLASLHTTVAMTVASGSPTPAATPEQASVRLNCRLLQGDTLQSQLDTLRKLAGEDAQVELLGGKDPSPASDINCREFQLLEQSIRHAYPDARVLPALLCAGTDAYYYYPICDCVCRFTGFLDVLCEGRGGHCVDERFAIQTLDTSTKLFYRYLKEYKEAD